MKIARDLNDLPPARTVVALGVFDGVHLGHQALLAEAKNLRRRDTPAVAVTFHPHPRTMTGHPNGYGKLLTPPEEKSLLFEDAGVDFAYTIPFTCEFARTSPRAFAESVLARGLKPEVVVCGFNFTFGYLGEGKPQDLQNWSQDLGFRVAVVPPVSVGDEIVSSTRIRAALAAGDVGEAARCLGRPYCITGDVVPGDGRGHKIGIATANVRPPDDKLVPGNGVYAAIFRVMVSPGAVSEDIAVVNIGTRPTFNGEGTRIEAHALGVDGPLYGRKVQICFLSRLRDERRFLDAEALRRQVEEDMKVTRREFLGVLSAQGAGADGSFEKARWFTVPKAYDKML